MMICLLCVMNACDTKPQHALKYAGENRAELEKVLTHYRNDSNPLKLRAAIFLIENMPGHRTFVGEEIEAYYRAVDGMIALSADKRTRQQKLDSIVDAHPQIWTNTAEDIHVISGDYLVENIDLAFRAWERSAYARHLDFDQFCDFVLPYKCAEFQQLDEWVELDFGRPVHVNKVRCVPRSDDNGIHFGDTYELNYWHRDGRQSLGEQIAHDNALYYENIPQNAPLLLQHAGQAGAPVCA
jgi:hypothetical protein